MALEALAEPFGQANRPEIHRHDQAGGPRPAERVEGDRQSHSCSLEQRCEVEGLCPHDGLRNPTEQILDQRRENCRYQEALSQNGLEGRV